MKSASRVKPCWPYRFFLLTRLAWALSLVLKYNHEQSSIHRRSKPQSRHHACFPGLDHRFSKIPHISKGKVRRSNCLLFYRSVRSSSSGLYNALQKFGYVVVFREHAESVLSKKKGNVDTDIVFSVMRKLVEKEPFDKVLLVSGDGDYWRMVNYLIEKNKFEKLLVPNKKNLSSLYRLRTPDTYRAYLDDPAIKKKLIHRKKK